MGYQHYLKANLGFYKQLITKKAMKAVHFFCFIVGVVSIVLLALNIGELFFSPASFKI